MTGLTLVLSGCVDSSAFHNSEDLVTLFDNFDGYNDRHIRGIVFRGK